jgi:pimeloyl-ACP methyl ester carboxylesterase
MIEPPGFTSKSIATSLGTMVYYTATTAPWVDAAAPDDNSQLPTLVFLHGFGGGSSAYEWSKVYPAFAGDYRILAPDLIGWGRSAHPDRNYQVEDYITTIIEFLEQTCPGATTVIASSLVAAITVRCAIERPDLFKSLILATPSGLSDFGEDYSRSLFAQIVSTPILDKLLYRLGIATKDGINNFLSTRQFAQSDRIFPEIINAYLASALEPNGDCAALAFVRGDLCFDLAVYVQQLTTPTAIIWGNKSQFTGSDIGKRLAALNPSVIKFFQIIPNVGLTPQLELPAVTIGLIRYFLPRL